MHGLPIDTPSEVVDNRVVNDASFWANKKVAVAGGFGFIGTHLVAALRDRNCAQVIPVGRRNYDLTDERQVIKLFEDHRPDLVVHLAGLVGNIVSMKERPADFFYQNLLMGSYLLHYSSRYGVQKFVGAIAGCDYAPNAPVPFKEEYLWNGLPQPETTAYSLAKRLLSVQASAYSHQYHLSTVTIVPGNTFGPGDSFDPKHARAIPSLIRRFYDAIARSDDELVVWGSGRATRDFIYISDAVDGILLAAERGSNAEIFNISSGIETSIRHLAELIAEATGFQGRLVWDTNRPEGQLRRCMDITKAQKRLGFRPTVGLRQGLEKTLEWYKSTLSNNSASASSS